MLVVGVVAADLRAAGAAEQGGGSVLGGGESRLEGAHHMEGPVTGHLEAGLASVQGVQGGQGGVALPGGHRGKELFTGTHGYHLFIKSKRV